MTPPECTATAGDTRRLGDWFAQPFALGRQRFILLAAEHSRLPVLMPARNAKHLAQTFPQELVTVLDRLQIPMEAIAREIGEMRECVIAATNNRSVLGTLAGCRKTKPRPPDRSGRRHALFSVAPA